MIKKISKLIIVLSLVGIIFGSGYQLGLEESETRTQPEEIDFSLFWEAYNRVEDLYVDSDEINEEEVVHGAIRGMLSSLDDPHTSFFDQDESKKFLEDVSGYYEGVGMEVGIRNGNIQVISPIEGTPASKAGIMSGDTILEIDGKSTSDMDLEEAVDLMRGEQGTDVTIVMGRNNETKEFTLNRKEIQVPSVDWELLEDDIAYLKIHYFHQDLANEFNEIVPKLSASEADKIILDLRNNPGGALDSALDIAKYFLEEGDVIVKSQGSDGEIEEVYEADRSSVTFNQDIVILINEGSASASEILAGALKHHRDSKIVGQTSFGKGSIQTLVNLSDMSNLKITISNWVTPSGELITDEGITPDYEVERNIEDFDEGRDPQLDKAIEIIK
ncbi:MAG: S41 family peptidase [Patescibacteria group bacterium]